MAELTDMVTKLAAALSLVSLLAACASPETVPVAPVATTESTSHAEPLTIGPAAADTYDSWIPDGQTLSAFDVSNPAWLNSIRRCSTPFRTRPARRRLRAST